MRLRILALAFISVAALATAAQPKAWTLEECIDYAKHHSPGVLQTATQLENQKITEKSVKNYWIPTVTTQMGYYLSTGTTDQQYFRYPYAYAFVNGTLFDGQSHSKGKMNHSLTESMEASLEQALHDIEVQVSTLYLQELYLADQEKLLRTQADTTVFSTDIERLQMESSIADVANQHTNVRLSLAQLIGVEDPLSFRVASLAEANALSLEELELPYPAFEDGFIEESPLLKAAKAQLQAAKNNVIAVKAARMPRIAWGIQTGSYYIDYFKRTDYQAIMGPFKDQVGKNFVFLPQISIVIPITQGGAVSRGIKQAEISVINSSSTLDATRKQFIIEAEKAYSQAVAAKAKYLVAEEKSKTQTDAQSRSDYLYARYDYLIKKGILEYYINH